jgi:hypothetical protein
LVIHPLVDAGLSMRFIFISSSQFDVLVALFFQLIGCQSAALACGVSFGQLRRPA